MTRFFAGSMCLWLMLMASPVWGQDGEDAASDAFRKAVSQTQQKLDRAVEELDELRERIADEKLPLTRQLRELENELIAKREAFQDTSRVLDNRTLDLTNLRSEIKSREDEANYLSNLLGEYVRNFETRLHIAELQRYEDVLEQAKLAPDNNNLSEKQVFEAQTALVSASIERLRDAIGGALFEGEAVDPDGIVKVGRFVLVGPYALFRSSDGEAVGTAEQRLGSLEPTVIPFEEPGDREAAANLAQAGEGTLPLDPTLGNAHKIEQTEDTLVEHVKKGGPVMVPILGLAALSLLIALYKLVALSLVRTPGRKKLGPLLDAAGRCDRAAAEREAGKIKGPVGEMLQAGAAHIQEPKDLIEELMYEKVLSTRLKLQRLLPIIAITAASAPLLGLLGTVTGIISTFQLITLYGTGDPKSLSGGISEALITTKFGLIVAVPSLLLYAFLNRKARGIVDQMEKSAVALVNATAKGKAEAPQPPSGDDTPPPSGPGGGDKPAQDQPDQAQAKPEEGASSGDNPSDSERKAA